MTMAASAAFVTALEDAASQGSGCLFVADGHAPRSGRVYFADGKIYAVQVDGFMPKVGHRLRTGGTLSDEQYDVLLSETDNNVYASNIGVLAVKHGFVAQDVLDAVLREILLSSVGAMFSWSAPVAKFKPIIATDQFRIPPVSVKAITKAVLRRRERWEDLWSQIAPSLSPESAYPAVSAAFDQSSEPLSSEVAAVVNASTGAISLDGVAGECGLTRFETGHVLGHLVNSGIVIMNTHPSETQTTGQVRGDQAQVHGTAETAFFDRADAYVEETSSSAETDVSGGDLPAAVEQIEQERPEIVPVVDAFAEAVAAEAREETESTSGDDPDDGLDAGIYDSEDADHLNGTQVASHFAPDVLATLTATEHSDDGDDDADEPSAFGDAEDALPDGMDLGSIPTEQIEKDSDPAASADVPSSSSGPLVAPAISAVLALDVHSKDAFAAPAPLPVALPHFTDPVAPVPAPQPAPSQAVGSEVPVLPPGVPVFVDASALDNPCREDVDGMPGVPLPPIPGFFVTPDAPVLPVPPIAPVPAPQAAPAVHEAEPSAAPHRHILETESEHLPAATMVDTVEDLSENAPAIQVEQATSGLIQDASTESSEEPRVAAARQRLTEEIGFAADTATSAERALARAEEDHEAHLAAGKHNQDTLDRYRNFLAEAEAERVRLNNEVDELTQANAATDEKEHTAKTQANQAHQQVAEAVERLDRAREALRAAQVGLDEAEASLALAQSEQEDATEALAEAATGRSEIANRLALVTKDLSEVDERIASYADEIIQIEKLSETLDGARSNAAALKAAAEQRLVSAERNLSTLQERLAHLG